MTMAIKFISTFWNPFAIYQFLLQMEFCKPQTYLNPRDRHSFDESWTYVTWHFRRVRCDLFWTWHHIKDIEVKGNTLVEGNSSRLALYLLSDLYLVYILNQSFGASMLWPESSFQWASNGFSFHSEKSLWNGPQDPTWSGLFPSLTVKPFRVSLFKP